MTAIHRFTVQVMDANRSPINHPTITATHQRGDVFYLDCPLGKGRYTTEKKLPKGHYRLEVSKQPFPPVSRDIYYTGDNTEELFFLFKEGTTYYQRGQVRFPFKQRNKEVGLIWTGDPAGKEKGTFAKTKISPVAKKTASEHKMKLRECEENIINNGIYIAQFPAKSTAKSMLDTCREIDKKGKFRVAPIMEQESNNASFLTNEIMIRFADHLDQKEIEAIIKKHKLKIVSHQAILGNVFRLTTGKTATYEVLDTSNALAKLEDVVFAEPNLIHTVEEDAVTPTDLLFAEQWDHNLMGTTDAWQFLRNMRNDLTFGSPDVLIAIVDSGVDGGHPEFSGTVTDGTSKVFQSFDFVNMVANNNSMTSDHGTCCASAATASGGNEGVSGVAPNCRVLAIRRGGTEADYAEEYLWAGGFDPGSSTANFPAQLSRGADIISSSFGFSTGAPISGTMTAVFDRLTDDGRDGRGCLLFFSAGNNNTDLDTDFLRPWGMYNRCFSVTASTLANDGVTEVKAGYSSFGSVVSFCAPSSSNGGVRVHNPPNSYGTHTATIRQSNPFSTDALTAAVNTGANTLTLGNVLGRWSGVIGINVGTANAEFHLYTTIASAPNVRSNQINLSVPLINNQGNGTAVNLYNGFVPGRQVATDQLNGAVVAGATTITLDSTTGFSIGQGIFLEVPGNANTEANIITDINGNVLSLAAGLLRAHADNVAVFAANADYRDSFGGTSHSTPLCAGVAALMLSANPALTWDETRDLLQATAVKINPGENNAPGQWQDINGNASNTIAYDGNPVFSEFYGFGRIDAAAAVREAGWDIELVTTALNFQDIPEGEEAARAVRFNVRSRWAADFNMSAPGNPFRTPLGSSQNIPAAADSTTVREVYLWVTYTGTNDGDVISAADGRSVTVTCPQTEQEWTIPITANTIGRKTAGIILALDQSGSMNNPSGVLNSKRIDILRFSANILADVIQEGNGLGIVSFDADPHDVLIPAVGPLGPASAFEVNRTQIKTAISGFTPTAGGATAIGDGLERAQARLNTMVGDYDTKSVIVLTDGKETADKYISDVSDSITDRTFAIGLGKAEHIEPTALNSIVNSNNGYLLLTDQLDDNSLYKLAKYFLQILAGVNNEDIVVDPDGTLYPDQQHRIPFVLNESDISSDVILLVPSPHVIDFAIETPDGRLLTPSDNAAVPGLSYSFGNNVQYYRLRLPLALGAGARSGKWYAHLSLNKKYSSYYYERAYTDYNMTEVNSSATGFNKQRGIPYSFLVHAHSNLKMDVAISQSGFEPGAAVNLQVRLTQYGIPLSVKADVMTYLVHPNGFEERLAFKATEVEGTYELSLVAKSSGVYQFRIIARGRTYRGEDFTRELARTAAVWAGGDKAPPSSATIPTTGNNQDFERWCKLLDCLTSKKVLSEEFRQRMLKEGIDLNALRDCLGGICRSKRTATGKAELAVDRSELTYLSSVIERLVSIGLVSDDSNG